MTHNINKRIIIAFFIIVSTLSCTDNFENINRNPSGATQDILEQDNNDIKSLFSPVFINILVFDQGWKYQVQQNLQGDIWGGYMATPSIYRGGTNNTTYDLVDNWNGYCWDTAYKDVMANLLKIKKAAEGKFNQLYSLSLILKVETMHRVTDTYGPVIYSSFGTTDSTIPYDSQEDVYKQMFADLDIAIEDLTTRVDSGEKSTFETTDMTIYKGDYTKWVKFANSLRLRLAVRLSKINPTLAKTEAEKAINHKFGVMENKADIFKIVSDKFIHPLSIISADWKDIRLSADVESILVGYNDPRLALYANPATDENPAVLGKSKGIRTGIEINAKSDHEGFSGLGDIINRKEIVLMNPAEVYFLRAEGALRGWNMGAGTAREFYEKGITASFEQHLLANVAEYINDNVKTAIDYVDPKDVVNNAAAVNNVTIAWDDVATNEIKLQKIITQKWIANFPEGQEAWTEWRRTGYPRLFPILKNTSGGVISSTSGVRRINFVQSEKDGNPGGVETGLSKLGGPDTGATKLWWDTGSNF